MSETISIFTYHRLFTGKNDSRATDAAEAFYAISELDFENHLRYLKENGFSTIGLEDFLSGNSHPKTVVITFDDGWVSDYEVALPLLQRYGFQAVFFLCVDFIGKAGFMDWRQIEALRDAGMSMQCHGLLHRDYSLLPMEEAKQELEAARLVLERNLGKPVPYLALPGGFASDSAYEAGFRAGFSAICNSEQALAKRGKIVRRFVLRRNTSQADFQKLANRDWKKLATFSALHVATSTAKGLLGGQRYESMKQLLWR
jgi:peptidoglycan/xylan/chitin deacetylase (PgdA/CDA1 family)